MREGIGDTYETLLPPFGNTAVSSAGYIRETNQPDWSSTMSNFTPKDTSSRPAFPEMVLKRSKIIRNGQRVWLYSKTN
jgi:hypothetical protein